MTRRNVAKEAVPADAQRLYVSEPPPQRRRVGCRDLELVGEGAPVRLRVEFLMEGRAAVLSCRRRERRRRVARRSLRCARGPRSAGPAGGGSPKRKLRNASEDFAPTRREYWGRSQLELWRCIHTTLVLVEYTYVSLTHLEVKNSCSNKDGQMGFKLIDLMDAMRVLNASND